MVLWNTEGLFVVIKCQRNANNPDFWFASIDSMRLQSRGEQDGIGADAITSGVLMKGRW